MISRTQPRVFFGTMNSGEGEFEKCCESISKQKDLQNNRHFVVSGLKEVEAHNTLWDAWESEKADFDLFVKVDADTILWDGIVSQVWRGAFQADPRVTGVQLKLFDFFTEAPISGLNFFSPRVRFARSSGLYPDRVDSGHDVVLKGKDVEFLGFAGSHCSAPTEIQAFHFGFHRMLKGQYDVLRRVYDAWKRESTLSPDYDKQKRTFALMGALQASLNLPASANYDDTFFHHGLEMCRSSSPELRRMMIERHFPNINKGLSFESMQGTT